MADLIIVLTSDQGSWNHVKKIIEECLFERAFIITNPQAKPHASWKTQTKIEYIMIDSSKSAQEIINQIVKQLKDKIGFSEVGLNLASGNGKEHMAVLSAVLKLGVGFRLVAATKEGVKEI